MNKVYILNQPLNASTFTVYTVGGNGVCYQFRGGNVNTKTPATFMTDNEYYQSVLENSEQFKAGIVKFDRSTAQAVTKAKADAAKKAQEEAEKEAEEAEAQAKADVDPAERISTVTEAINYCAEKWGEVVKNTKQAKECALAHGSDFPNLKLKV